MATKTPSGADLGGKIEIFDVPALLKWEDDQTRGVGTSLSSTPVTLDIDFDSTTRVASFRLRIALLQRSSDKPVPLFLLILSSQIQSLVISGSKHTNHDSITPDRDTACLQFQLSSPTTLIVPPEPLRLKDKSQLSVMRSLRWVARQTILMVHVRNHVLSPQQIIILSEAPYAQFTSGPRHADIARLYGGRGGKVLDATTDETPPKNPPPSYNDVPAPPPMAPVHYGTLIRFCTVYTPLHDVDCT